MRTRTEYSITPVFGAVTEALQRDAAAFWLQNGAVGDANEAARRAFELVCVARNAAGEIVGVNTAYVSNLRTRDDRWFHYRMFLRLRDRHLHLARALMRAAIATLHERRPAAAAIQGIALVTENPKLMRASGRRLIASFGWQRIGKDTRGLDVWTITFA